MVRLFGHYVSKSFVALGVTEYVALLIVMHVGVWIRFHDVAPPYEVPVYPVWPKAIIYALVVAMCMVALGLYHRDHRPTPGGILLRILLALALGALIMSGVFYFFPSLFLGRGAFGYTLALSLPAIVGLRVVFYRCGTRRLWSRRVLVLGTGESAEHIAELKRTGPRSGFELVGFMRVQGEHDVVPESQILTDRGSLLDIVKANRVDEIVVTVRNRWQGLPVDDMLEAKLCGVRITDLLTFFERETGRIKLDALYPSWLIFSDGFNQQFMQGYGKRAFDIVISLLVLIIGSPLMLLAVIGIWLESGMKGPIIYSQIRIGKDWQLIQVPKFRSMRVDAEKPGVPVWAKPNDDRVTRVGGFIRKTRIDELPQLVSVLRGEMSFVGPRPERPEFVESLAKSIPYYSERLRVKPGITGWAQVRYQYAACEEDTYNKLEYDLYYVKNFSLFLDFLILLYTAEVILWRKGAV